MKNLCAAVTALMLMLLILVAREPKPAFTSEECILLLKSVADVDNWNSGKPPIKSVKGIVDGNSGVITLKVYVDETFDEKICAELEKDVKHDYLMALVENFDPDALIGRGGGQDVYPFCKWKWQNESRSGNSEINPLIEGIFLSR